MMNLLYVILGRRLRTGNPLVAGRCMRDGYECGLVGSVEARQRSDRWRLAFWPDGSSGVARCETFTLGGSGGEGCWYEGIRCHSDQ
jgi:hypothetical protein